MSAQQALNDPSSLGKGCSTDDGPESFIYRHSNLHHPPFTDSVRTQPLAHQEPIKGTNNDEFKIASIITSTDVSNQNPANWKPENAAFHSSNRQASTISAELKNLYHSICGIWFWEVLSICFSIICIVAVIILAHRIDNMWLSKWKIPLQPSTLISILITAAQSSVMLILAETLNQLKWLNLNLAKPQPLIDLTTFESASRSPLGSLYLMYSWNPSSVSFSAMVYLTSVVSLAALAMGPFAQQIVSVQTNVAEPVAGAHSTIAIADRYYLGDAAGLSLDVQDGKFTMNIVGHTTNVQADIQGAFFSGIYGLGSHLVDFSCPSGNCTWPSFTSLGVCSQCNNITATTNITRSLDLNEPTKCQAPGGWKFDLYFDTTVEAQTRSSKTLESLSANMLSLAIAQQSSYNSSINVTECSISWCAKEYSHFRVVNGVVQNSSLIRDLPLKLVRGQTWRNTKTSNSVSDFPIMLTLDENGDDKSTPFPNYSVFNVSVMDHLILSGYIAEHFKISQGDSSDYFGAQQNVAAGLANITTSITRKIPRPESETIVQGTVLHQQSIIRIQYIWLALPIALIIISGILLLLTDLKSKRYQVPIWKSSPLPYLYHGIRHQDHHEKTLGGGLEKVREMEEEAKSTPVTMFRSTQGGTWLSR